MGGADENLIPIPTTQDTINSTVEHDYFMLSDIFATGWASVDRAGF